MFRNIDITKNFREVKVKVQGQNRRRPIENIQTAIAWPRFESSPILVWRDIGLPDTFGFKMAFRQKQRWRLAGIF